MRKGHRILNSVAFSRCALIVALLLTFGFGINVTAQTSPSAELRVLFIGNSLTYTNDIPGIVQVLAKTNKRKLTVRSVTEPNFSLEEHWTTGDAVKLLEKEKWDYVVLQQGPSAADESRAHLLKFSRMFAEKIRQATAKPALYMVWNVAARKDKFDGVIRSYTKAAKDIDGLLFPVGEAWLEAWKLDPKLELYSSDGLHPSVEGSFLAALVIYRKLYGEPVAGLPHELRLDSGKKIKIDEKRAQTLQQAAAKVSR